MDKIRELILDICDDVTYEWEYPVPVDRYRLEEWLDNNAKFRELKDYITGANIEFGMDMRVKDLRAILSRIEDEDMNIIIPVLDKEDDKYIHSFRHVRTAGILTNEYEPQEALCLSAPGDGLDMYSQLAYNSFEATMCKQGLF
jgi:hypothetical protein